MSLTKKSLKNNCCFAFIGWTPLTPSKSKIMDGDCAPSFSVQIKLKPPYFVNLFREIGEILQTPVEIKEVEFSVGIAKMTSQTKDSPKLRSQLRQYLEPRTQGILAAINKELFEPAGDKLKQQGKKGLVAIVDNLDRLDNSVKPTGHIQPEYLFVERGEQLKQLNCHVIYTIPLVLRFSSALGRLMNRFGGEPKALPMVPVQLRQGGEFREGRVLLQQMVMARAFPEKNIVERVNLVTEVFDSPETLAQLCRVSGGHVRNLLMLLARCLEIEDPPLKRDCIEGVIRQRCNELTLAITEDEWKLLRQVAQHKSLRGEERYQTLVRLTFNPNNRSFVLHSHKLVNKQLLLRKSQLLVGNNLLSA